MGALTHIQWATHTFNPWVGCTKVSPGCTNCYAEAYDKRIGGVPKHQRADPSMPQLRWGKGAPRTRTSEAYWRQPLKWNRIASELGKRHRVFCASLADVFDSDGVDVSTLADLARLIKQTPSLDWLLLTKRPENFWRWKTATAQSASAPIRWPDNVWLGVTVENQKQALERIPLLIAQSAAVRFLSCEPLLEAIDLSYWMPALQWVIVGGESGPKARVFDVAWARDLVRQCKLYGVSAFVKQLGAAACDPENGLAGAGLKVHPDASMLVSQRLIDSAGGDWSEWPADLRVRELPEALPR
jgi:protein gp37